MTTPLTAPVSLPSLDSVTGAPSPNPASSSATASRHDPARERRRTKTAPATQPPQLVRLRDGAPILVRPLMRRDRDLIADAYDRLRRQTRYRRFQSTAPHLSSRDLDRLSDVDHTTHVAVVAIDPATGRLIGVARYIALPESTGDAEVAALVVDDWKHRGVGTRLMQSLSERAQANRVRRFIAVVDQENRPVIELLERAGATHVGIDRQLTFAITVAAWQDRAERSDGHYLADSSEAVSGGVDSG